MTEYNASELGSSNIEAKEHRSPRLEKVVTLRKSGQ